MTCREVAVGPICPTCRRPVRAHGNRRRHWRVCPPVTGTGPGAMTPAERERYLAGAPR